MSSKTLSTNICRFRESILWKRFSLNVETDQFTKKSPSNVIEGIRQLLLSDLWFLGYYLKHKHSIHNYLWTVAEQIPISDETVRKALKFHKVHHLNIEPLVHENDFVRTIEFCVWFCIKAYRTATKS